jgi:hypothetical protein
MPILGIIASQDYVRTPPGAYDSIASAAGTGSSNTITFSSIPSTYKHLQIRFNAIIDVGCQILLRANGDTGASNYTKHYTLGRPSGTLLSGGEATTGEMLMFGAYGSVATYPNVGIIDIFDYASTTKYKTAKSFAGANNNTGTNGENDIFSGLWKSTSAINSISIIVNSGSFATTSKVSLYGIKGA